MEAFNVPPLGLEPRTSRLRGASSKPIELRRDYMLSHQDSNLDEQNQNLSCCHYTMGQSLLRREEDSNLHGFIHGQFITPDR